MTCSPCTTSWGQRQIFGSTQGSPNLSFLNNIVYLRNIAIQQEESLAIAPRLKACISCGGLPSCRSIGTGVSGWWSPFIEWRRCLATNSWGISLFFPVFRFDLVRGGFFFGTQSWMSSSRLAAMSPIAAGNMVSPACTMWISPAPSETTCHPSSWLRHSSTSQMGWGRGHGHPRRIGGFHAVVTYVSSIVPNHPSPQ